MGANHTISTKLYVDDGKSSDSDLVSDEGGQLMMNKTATKMSNTRQEMLRVPHMDKNKKDSLDEMGDTNGYIDHYGQEDDDDQHGLDTKGFVKTSIGIESVDFDNKITSEGDHNSLKAKNKKLLRVPSLSSVSDDNNLVAPKSSSYSETRGGAIIVETGFSH